MKAPKSYLSQVTPQPRNAGGGLFKKTGCHNGALSSLYTAGNLFHHAAILNDAVELPAIISRLAVGVTRPSGFVAHLGLPLSVQTARASRLRPTQLTTGYPAACDEATFDACVELLAKEPFVIWVGFGARHAAKAVRALAERASARVMCSPRAKGIFPEDSPLFLGVTGLGGHSEVEAYLKVNRPSRALVLGTRLGEFSSFWSLDLAPSHGFIHVDLDTEAFGTAYPTVPTIGIQAEIGAFLTALLARWPQRISQSHEMGHRVRVHRLNRFVNRARCDELFDGDDSKRIGREN